MFTLYLGPNALFVQINIACQIWTCYFERQPNNNNNMLEVRVCFIHTSFHVEQDFQFQESQRPFFIAIHVPGS
jgi:hypothetical protein